ncbi:MAG: holo-ACP synthase [Oscillospiraceae bacterium]|nr:holo-ACP synthase [Oscillospiraceae bacterium]
MIGVGVDMVSIQQMTYLMELDAFVRRTFTEREIEAFRPAPNQVEYLATHFVAKEAVFKALAHFTKEKRFDMRIVESLRDADGFPYIVISEKLRCLMKEARASALSVSISTENNLAISFVVAE